MEFSTLLEISFIAIFFLIKDSLSLPLQIRCPEPKCNTPSQISSDCKLVPRLYLYYGRLCVACPNLQCSGQQDILKDSFKDVVRSHILQSAKDSKKLAQKSRSRSPSTKSSLFNRICNLRGKRRFGIRGRHSLRSSIFRERDSDEVIDTSFSLKVPSF